MARNKNKLSGLVNQLTSSNVGGSSSGTSGSAGKPALPRGTRTLSMGSKSALPGIRFGHPSNIRTSSGQSGSSWTGLLKQSASGGAASAFSGGLSSLGGIGGLFSGIMSLFGGGGKSTPPALVQFQLPNSMSQTVYVSSKGSAAYQGNSVETPSASGTPASQAGGNQLQYQSTAIAQAVKTALLNSSSLNDVIAEL